MIYRILGQLVIGSNGGYLALPSGHRLTVLANLLINANRRVSTPDLLRASWGRPDIDETQLHKCVSHLRVLLATLGRRGDLVTHSRYGYELRVDEADLDKLVFERLVRDAETAAAEHRTDDEVEALHAALRLWRGPHPLAGVPGDSFRKEAADLEQRRKRAAVRLFDLELRRGHREEILGELHRMAGYHPTDRRLCEQLMLALYRSGHATEALAAYNQHSAALGAETAAEPEVRLRDLMYAIASADEQAVARYEVSVGEAGGPVRPNVVPRQLPPDPADFVGRDDPVAEARWLLGREPGTATPVVVATGPGGIGKTALALHVAHLVRANYPDGQLYVELHGTTPDPVATEEVLAQVLRAFGVANVPESRDERAGLYRSLVAERRVLLLLDDARDEAQIRDLVPASPTCAVLVTSRERLSGVSGAHHLPALRPLSVPAAIDLFQRVVRRSGVNPHAEPEATRRVAQLCAGLPLALCVAGALRGRDTGRSTAELAERLAQQSLDGFVYGDRSVERSIAAGFDRLGGDAQLLFLGLGLLRLPEFGLWTAAAVLDGTGADPVEALLRLAGSHMVEPAGAGMRHRFHELTREYAHRRAEGHHPTGEVRLALRERVYGGLLTLARRAHRGHYGGDYEVVHGGAPTWVAPKSVLDDLDGDHLAWFETERRNIRAAVRHTAELGLAELCWDLAVSTHEFYNVRGYLDDWHATHLEALAACRTAGNARGEAVVTVILGQPALVTSRRAGMPGPDDLARAVAVFERLRDRHGQAIALRTLANNLRRRGQLHRALEIFARALALYQACGDVVGSWQSLRYIGQTQLDLGRPDEALRMLREAEEAARDAGQPRLMAQTAYWIGLAQVARRDVAEAREALRYLLDAVGDTNDSGRAYASHGLGEVALLANELDEAEHHLSTAADLAGQVADAVLGGRVHRSLANLRRAQGRAADEITALAGAVGLFGSRNATYLQADALTALGAAQARRGDTDSARAAWTNAHALYSDMGLPDADRITRCLDELAD